MERDILKDYKILIPARRNSKGLPFKNRKLIQYTLNSIPEYLNDKVLISTDDEFIIEKYDNFYNVVKRTERSSGDRSSTKSVLIESMNHFDVNNIIMLYLTYPQRTFSHIVDAVKFFELNKAKSMLCSKTAAVSPYLMMYRGEEYKGRQIISHDLYRRQDYPECFEISHFISIFKKSEILNLNNNLYNEDTIFYPIDDFVDVDTHEDLERFNEKNKDNRRNWN